MRRLSIILIFSGMGLVPVMAQYPITWVSDSVVSVLNNHFLYEPDKFAGSNPGIVSVQVENILKRGWELEFRQKEYSNTKRNYKGPKQTD